MRHTITESALEEWLREPQWRIYASSGGSDSRKRLEVDKDVFRVTVMGDIVFLGSDRAAAVAAYNEAS